MSQHANNESGQSRQEWFFRLPHAYCTADPGSMQRIATAADAAGLDGVSAQDHLYSSDELATCGDVHVPSGSDDAMLDAISTLAFAAAVTDRVKLLTSVLVLPLHHPARLAKQVSSLDFLSGGRVVCGVGIGAPPTRADLMDNGQNLKSHGTISEEEYRLIGSPRHRGKFADEALTAILALWSGTPEPEGVRVDGDQVRIVGRGFTPAPRDGRIPLWIGGRSEAAQRRAVRFDAGWFPSQPASATVAKGKEFMDELAQEMGREADREIGINVFFCIGGSTAQAVAQAKQVLGHRFADEATLRSQTIIGDIAEVQARLDEYAAAGVTAIDFKPISAPIDQQIDWIRALADLRA